MPNLCGSLDLPDPFVSLALPDLPGSSGHSDPYWSSSPPSLSGSSCHRLDSSSQPMDWDKLTILLEMSRVWGWVRRISNFTYFDGIWISTNLTNWNTSKKCLHFKFFSISLSKQRISSQRNLNSSKKWITSLKCSIQTHNEGNTCGISSVSSWSITQ